MKRIEWHASLGFVGATRRGEVYVEDDCTDEEIEEIVSEEMNNFLEWGWKEVGKE